MQAKTNGLLLQVIPYLGQKKILKIFTPTDGLISLFIKKERFVPFCLAEWVYKKGTNDLYSFVDGSLLDPMYHLKKNFETLTAAGGIAKDLLTTQLPGKSAQDLFTLALVYLKHLETAPLNLAHSFKLKLLVHEGLFSDVQDPLFDPEEWEKVKILAFARNLSILQTVKDIPFTKIKKLFEDRK